MAGSWDFNQGSPGLEATTFSTTQFLRLAESLKILNHFVRPITFAPLLNGQSLLSYRFYSGWLLSKTKQTLMMTNSTKIHFDEEKTLLRLTFSSFVFEWRQSQKIFVKFPLLLKLYIIY